MFESAFDSSVNEIEEENNQVNDRFKKVEGYHVIPPPYTGNYMPSRPDLSFAGLDDSIYKTNVSETITSVPRNESTASKSSKDSLEQPKDVSPSAPIIEEWESDSDDECVFRPSIEQNKPSYAKINFVKSDENTRKSVIEQHTYRQAKIRKQLQQRLDMPVNAAKQSSSRATTSISTSRHVNTVASKPKVNAASPTKYFYFKAHSPLRRPFNQKSAAKTNNFSKKVYTAKLNNVTTAGPEVVVSTAGGKRGNGVKSSTCWIWRPTGKGNPQYTLQDQGIFDSGCSRHMTGNKSFLTDYQEIDGGFVAFGGSPKGGKITGKGKIRTGKLDFEDVYFVKELKFNLFSVSQMCDKKNSVLFTETECLVLSPDFKLLDESQVLLKVPRQNNMYSFDLKNVVPSGGLTCLFAKATIDESNLWHRRLGHINFKTMNKLVTGNLVRGLPSKIFENDHTCVACQKGKPHKASCKTKLVSSISQPLQTLHMDLFGPTFVKSLNKKMYFLVVTDDFSSKFEGKADEGFLVGYSVNSKAFRVFNTRTRKVEENLHIKFLENKSNVAGSGPEWLFDIDSLTKSMNYEPVTAENQTNDNAGIKTNVNAGQAGQKEASKHEYILLPFMPSNSPLSSSTQSSDDKDADEIPSKGDDDPSINTVNANINTSSLNINTASPIPNMTSLEETGIFDDAYDDREVGAEADTNNLELLTVVSPIPTTRVHKDHPKEQIIGDLNLTTQTRRMINFSKENAMVWTLVDLPNGMRAIGTKWVFRNKKDERGIVVRNKARLKVRILVELPHRPACHGTKWVYINKKRIERIKFKKQGKMVGTEVTPNQKELIMICILLLFARIKQQINDWSTAASRPDIMFAVCACARFQVTPKVSHLHAVKRIFRYLKGQPKLGLWYPRDSPFDLEAFSDSDYVGASLDRKSTTGAEYVVAANCCGQVLWIQNQMLDYGFNFMNTKIYIDNESTIYIVKNPVFYCKTKHIEIRHHFIRDSYEKKLIQVIKIHTDLNVADLLIKAFDVSRFNFLIASIGLLNL
ncbi:ribonuclease H-like domain-containing protein [Tanacetum coccineum]